MHQGFGQLTVATFLTVVVVGAHHARRRRATPPRDRLLLRLLLGALCVLTLAVVASALYRMSLYQDAFGYTVLRVFVDGFELWLGLVVVFLLVAGVRLSGWWVPRAVLVSAAVFALGLRRDEPGRLGRRAQHRPVRGGLEPLDTVYLSHPRRRRDPGHRRPAPGRVAVVHHDLRGRARPFETDDWLAWNLGRSRAATARDSLPGTSATSCTPSADDYRP